MRISIPFIFNKSLKIQAFAAIFLDCCAVNIPSHQSYLEKLRPVSLHMLKEYMVGQNGKYFDHVCCMKRGEQIKFCVTNHFEKMTFPSIFTDSLR